MKKILSLYIPYAVAIKDTNENPKFESLMIYTHPKVQKNYHQHETEQKEVILKRNIRCYK